MIMTIERDKERDNNIAINYYAHSLPGRPQEEWQQRNKNSGFSGLNCLSGLNSCLNGTVICGSISAGEWGWKAIEN